jgi:GDP-L-fucose synthase
MKILLTGSSGMVGKNILEHPGAARHNWLTPSHNELDFADFQAVRTFLGEHRPDCIIHAAGKVGGIHANMREPVQFLVANLDMGRNLLLAAAGLGIVNVINIGSSCMYPRNRLEALLEDDILTGELEPTNEGYALAKITVARLAEYLCRENPRLSFKTVIPCNLYGRHDKFDPQWSHLIPAVIHKIHLAKTEGQATVDIWGDGNARREFMYSGDLADALLLAVENPQDLPSLMNIGLGIDYSVNEYYRAAADVIGYKGQFVHDLSKPVGMQRKLTNVSKALNWGWQATTSLHDGISKTYEFYLTTTAGH